MGGFFGVASKEDCIFDLFFGVDYHCHLGTRRAGLTTYDEKTGFVKLGAFVKETDAEEV